MKEKLKIIGIIMIIILALAWYPWFMSVNNGETKCHNIFGITMKCE